MDNDKIILFPFTVNKTFIERNFLTIKKRYYPQLEKEGFVNLSGSRKTEIMVNSLKYNRLVPGQIYYGKAGYGWYYQIRINMSRPTDYFGHFKKLETILVALEKKDGKVYVTLYDNMEERLKRIDSLMDKK